MLCSLRPNEEKLAYSAIFEMNDKAEVKNSRIVKTVIKSDRRFTYEEAQAVIETGEGEYKEEILRLKDEYAGRIGVFLGLEMEMYSPIEPTGYEYLIGSSHYFDFGGRKVGFDRSAKVVAQVIGECFGGDGLAYAREYYRNLARLPEYGDFDIIGHFDLITKFTEGWGFDQAGNLVKKAAFGSNRQISDLIDTQDERYVAAWKRAIDRIFDDCEARYKAGYRNRLEELGVLKAGDKPVFEINTGAISKGYRTLPYPAADQIDYIKSKGGVLVLSSDSHAAGTICSGFDEFANLVNQPL
jgi:histidinol-phosphatase (PHP family)